MKTELTYNPLPTIHAFHASDAINRCIVGPVGSGKTTGAAWEVLYYIPHWAFKEHGIKRTRCVIVRNTFPELRDTTQRTVFDWFSWGRHQVQAQIYTLRYPSGIEVELLFRSCDNVKHVRQFKSLEITGYWVDESIEVADETKLMLKARIGRFPSRSEVSYGIETTNPPDVEHPTYSEFAWTTEPPGPKPVGEALTGHVGFWQPPNENKKNLPKGYYDRLRESYRDNPDWIEMYIEGKPGVIVRGKLVYHNFRRDRHVAGAPLLWSHNRLYRGWDNTGNCPACVVVQVPTAGQIQVLAEFFTDKENIQDFTHRVISECNMKYPNAEYVDYADPACKNKFSRSGGGFTSNKQLMEDIGVDCELSEQNLDARINSVDGQLGRYDGLLIDPSCIRLINGFLGGYHYPKTGDQSYSRHISKNRFSHVHDSLQYVLVKLVGNKKTDQLGHNYNKRRFNRSRSSWMAA